MINNWITRCTALGVVLLSAVLGSANNIGCSAAAAGMTANKVEVLRQVDAPRPWRIFDDSEKGGRTRQYFEIDGRLYGPFGYIKGGGPVFSEDGSRWAIEYNSKCFRPHLFVNSPGAHHYRSKKFSPGWYLSCTVVNDTGEEIPAGQGVYNGNIWYTPAGLYFNYVIEQGCNGDYLGGKRYDPARFVFSQDRTAMIWLERGRNEAFSYAEDLNTLHKRLYGPFDAYRPIEWQHIGVKGGTPVVFIGFNRNEKKYVQVGEQLFGPYDRISAEQFTPDMSEWLYYFQVKGTTYYNLNGKVVAFVGKNLGIEGGLRRGGVIRAIAAYTFKGKEYIHIDNTDFGPFDDLPFGYSASHDGQHLGFVFEKEGAFFVNLDGRETPLPGKPVRTSMRESEFIITYTDADGRTQEMHLSFVEFRR